LIRTLHVITPGLAPLLPPLCTSCATVRFFLPAPTSWCWTLWNLVIPKTTDLIYMPTAFVTTLHHSINLTPRYFDTLLFDSVVRDFFCHPRPLVHILVCVCVCACNRPRVGRCIVYLTFIQSNFLYKESTGMKHKYMHSLRLRTSPP